MPTVFLLPVIPPYMALYLIWKHFPELKGRGMILSTYIFELGIWLANSRWIDYICINSWLCGYGLYQWISQAMDRANTPINSLLEQAACIIGRCKEAAGETEPTEGYKEGKQEELIKFANGKRSMDWLVHTSTLLIWIEAVRMTQKSPRLICQSGAFLYNMISNFSGWGYGLISFLYRPSAVNKYW